MAENKSEVARIRHQIEQECEAMNRGFTEFASVARHAIVMNKYRNLAKYQEQLGHLVGEEEALNILCVTYNTVVK